MQRFVHESPEFLKAWDFQLSYNPNPELDYQWVAEHSTDEFKRLSCAVDSLDEKADSLIRYLAAGSGFISLAMLLGGAQSEALLFLIVMPTLLFLLIALCLAVMARKPQLHPAPPYTQEAFEFVDFFKNAGARYRFAAKVGSASVAMKLVSEFKAVHVRWAFRFFIYGVAYLVVATICFRFLCR
jgi:hypothetical protein